jgi:hypothetical protein
MACEPAYYREDATPGVDRGLLRGMFFGMVIEGITAGVVWALVTFLP